mgnify:CR=1 FL=1
MPAVTPIGSRRIVEVWPAMYSATALRDFLKTGVIRNAVNFPSVAPEEFQKIQPYVELAKQLGSLLGQMGEARIEALTVRYYGELASGNHPLIANAALVGLFQAILSDTVTEVNARAVAKGLETAVSDGEWRNFTSQLPADYADLLLPATILAELDPEDAGHPPDRLVHHHERVTLDQRGHPETGERRHRFADCEHFVFTCERAGYRQSFDRLMAEDARCREPQRARRNGVARDRCHLRDVL